MATAMGSPHEVASAAHLPAAAAATSAVSHVAGAGAAATAIRVEGSGPSVEHRCQALKTELESYGPIAELHTRNSMAFWREVRDAAPVAAPADRIVWRVSVAPMGGHMVAAAVATRHDLTHFYDWAGGLVWLSLPPGGDGGAKVVRAAVAAVGGHATLLRAPADIRAAVPPFQPQPQALAALARRIKDSFDPRRVLNPGRMTAGV